MRKLVIVSIIALGSFGVANAGVVRFAAKSVAKTSVAVAKAAKKTGKVAKKILW